MTVERPLRLSVDLDDERCEMFRAVCREAREEPLANLVDRFPLEFGPGPHHDFNLFMERISRNAKEHGVKFTAKQKKLLQEVLAERCDRAEPVVRKRHKQESLVADPVRGIFEVIDGGRTVVVEFEPDSQLRETEQIPVLEDGGIETFFRREVLPETSDAWYVPTSVKTGYEISFTRYFYKPTPLRSLEAIRGDILATETKTSGLLSRILGGGAS